MIQIKRFACENQITGCVTDERNPRFSFYVEEDTPGTGLKAAELSVNGWTTKIESQLSEHYRGPELAPFTQYTAQLTVTDDHGCSDQTSLVFETGRLNTPWQAKWISDPTYKFTDKAVSPVPMTFRKVIRTGKPVSKARIYATAMGIYELELNGQKVGNRYFAPGFTSYKHNLQYQTYDVTDLLRGEDELRVIVAGGWAVGSFVFTRKNRVYADRQALLLELRITYADGTEAVIGTDETWSVTEDGPFKMADIYDGETYDATCGWDTARWRSAAAEALRLSPKIMADYGAPVVAHERLEPISCTEHEGKLIYDFGQNFAGVVHLTINGKRGQMVTVKHAELLNPDGSLNVKFLRTAKAAATYTCVDGIQTYSPRLTYMGFRYISVEGIPRDNIEVSALALYSDVEQTGDFECSDPMLNRLQQNILWSSKSNFVDIPTDCPQRDERMGWTGDIAVFSPVACYNFNMSRFLNKWMLDLQAEQLPSGGVPNTIPLHGFGFPATMPVMAVAWWDDACILVPWNEYRARGDVEILRKYYPGMKKYIKACCFWAGLLSTGKNKYIWDVPGMLCFGDWVAPDVPQMSQWQARGKWTGTASLRNCSNLVAKIAEILGEEADAAYYADLSAKVADAYCSVLTDGNGKLLEEFQTAYVLPLHLDMFPNAQVKAKAAENLVKLVERSDYCIGTGFPGTPYILFALADNGHVDTAYQMLMNTKCPSWLYQVKMGATTIWERWDGLDENGECPIGDDGTDIMISYNHYASGAVGDFLYRRVAGIEALEPGYKTFQVRPVLGGGLTWSKSHVLTPYGQVSSDWKIENGQFIIETQVPVGTTCKLTMPNGEAYDLASGKHTHTCPV